MSKRKKKRKLRFFNRPMKIGLGIGAVGASLELGSTDLYTLLADYPNYIFWLEIAKYSTMIIGAIFAGGGIVKQANQDLKSIKVGERVKEGIEKIEELENQDRDTNIEEYEERDSTLKDVFELGRSLFSRRNKRK